MTTEPQSEKPEAHDPASRDNDTSETRRKLLRAGLAAAPVLMAVKSQSVLACGGSYGGGGGGKQRITCSAFASIKAANAAGITLSHHPNGTNPSPCKSPIEWKTCNHPKQYYDKKNCYFHDKSYKTARTRWDGCGSWGGDPDYGPTPSSNWHDPRKRNAPPRIYATHEGCTYSNFPRKDDNHNDRTLQEMLYCSDPLARHLVATILNKTAGYDPDNILPTQSQCQKIWGSNGVWTPPNCTTTWSRADTIAWFDMCYGTCST